jgi:hypothetical protein
MDREKIIAELKEKYPSVYGGKFRVRNKPNTETDEELLQILLKVRVRWDQQQEIQKICDEAPKPMLACNYGCNGWSLGLNEKSGRRVIRKRLAE